MSESEACPAFNPLDPALIENPYPVYERLREHGPLHHIEGLGWYAAMSYEAAAQVINSTDGEIRFVEFQKLRAPNAEQQPYVKGAAEFVLMKTGKDHRRLRGAFIRTFTRPRVDAMRPEIHATAHALIDSFEADGETELIGSYCMKLPLTIISRLLDVPESDQQPIAHLMEGFAVALQWLPMDEQQLKKANDAITGLADYFSALIADRRRDPGEDLLTALIAEADAGAMTEAELLSNAWGLYAAGHETTGSAIGNAVLTLIDHPDQVDQMLADRTLVPKAVDEIMRYRGLAQGAHRIFDHEVEIAGQKIPPNTPIVSYFASANRDETVVPDPNRFDITREQTIRHLSFSGGPHTCAGQHLAVVQMEHAIEALFTRLRGLEVIGEIKWNKDALLFQGPIAMNVRWRT
ncbi:MAG: cytochrome P450 [Solirubrobacteraceae bacterium]